jgi:transcriptional regulator with XRE-family HTH domain
MSNKIKEVREALNMTQEELAEKSGVSLPTVLQLENGTARTTTTKTLVNIARALDTGVDQLFPRKEGMTKTTKEQLIEQVKAAQIMEDEIYPIKRDADKAYYLIGWLFDQFFSDEFSLNTQEGREKIVYRYDNARALANILIDYVHRIKGALDSLEEIATEKS